MPRFQILLTIGMVCFFAALARAEEMVTVHLIAAVPKTTPADAKLFLAGNLAPVGGWNAEGAPMIRAGDGTYKINLSLPKGQTLEYKITRGMWETVEKGAGGEEIDNRTLKLDGDTTEKITVESWADRPPATAPTTKPKPKSTLTGDVRYHEHFHSNILNNDRRILVWLPPRYDADKSTRYPVLYLHDGQNVFDAATSFAGEWRADETAMKLITSGEIEPIIMVGVSNTQTARGDEYGPTRDAHYNAGGKGELYARFLIEELKPMIDRTYRTLADRDHTAVAGSSMGGLISLYLGLEHGDVFSRIGALSPTLQWDDQRLLKQVQADPSRLKRHPLKIWLDMGTAEGDDAAEQEQNITRTRMLASTFQAAGMKPRQDYMYLEAEGAAHNEAAWEKRFPRVLKFFFSKEKQSD